MMELSMAINKAIKKYPPVCNSAMYQSIIDLSMKECPDSKAKCRDASKKAQNFSPTEPRSADLQVCAKIARLRIITHAPLRLGRAARFSCPKRKAHEGFIP